MVANIVDVLRMVDSYTSWLCAHGCKFDSLGLPIPKREWYLQEWPEGVVTYRERNSSLVTNRNKTALCLFCADERMYPRFEKVFSEIDVYREYMGVVGADLTVTADMDIAWQREIILLNQLFTAVLALNGVKIVQNLRIGSSSTLDCLSNVPSGVMCASGTLGCANIAQPHDFSYAEKIFQVRPSGVLLYGKDDPIMRSQLELAGVPYRLYRDTHTLHKMRTVGDQRCGCANS